MNKPCNYPGCSVLIQRGTYCEKHKVSAPKRHGLYDKHIRQRDPALANAARIRASARWKRVRLQTLADDPMCADPFGEHARNHTTRTATQVHHIRGLIDHPELAYHADNLQPLCTACHARIERDARRGVASAPALPQAQPDTSGPAFG